MIYKKGKIENIDTYKGYRIVIEHSLNIFENTKENEYPIYTILGMGRRYQGNIKSVKRFIDNMFLKYGKDEK